MENAVVSRVGAVNVVFNVLAAMRPKQWTKNAVLFAGLVFAGKMLHPDLVARVVAAAVLFCALSGAVYLINDIKDIDADRLHPKKRLRPIASGRLSVSQAWGATMLLLLFALPGAWLLSPPFGAFAVAYLAMMLAYNLKLKEVVILDVLVIAAGFVLRAVAGSLVVGVPISPWLYVCTSLLALFLGFGKRRHELVLLDRSAASHRKILDEYSPALLDQLMSAVTASTVIAYSLYSFFSETSHKAPYMMLTIPFVVYATFRYLYLIYGRGEGGSPEEALLRDRPLLGAILLWGAAVVLVIYTSA
ncbi:MAG: decaprenyl-phosphate phosphoribosyltransferase [Sphingomonadaceae bacterium]